MKSASSLRTLPALAATVALLFPGSARADVVINEVLHDSEPNTVCNEFIELHNTGPGDADLSGWFFSNGVDYTFPANTMLNEGEYVVVAGDPATILAVFSAQALGPWTTAAACMTHELSRRQTVLSRAFSRTTKH